MRSIIADSKRLVVKVGSSLVTNDGKGLDHAAIGRWAAQIAALRGQGKEVVLVSSGAIAEGMQRLGWSKRPREIDELQAAAAVGQMGLAQVYESRFSEHGIQTAQILLTHADLADRERYLNARSTLLTLLRLGVVPIINENDTVVTDEIKFGDNDTLGALVANLIEGDALIILTDQSGLFTADPRKDPSATLVAEASAGAPELEAMAGGAGSSLGRGGMLTKILAAKRANTVCVVMVADCLPVLLCDADGRAVGAAHAGWRGLAAGIVEQTAARVAELAGGAADRLHAFLGPAIGPQSFEVGADVRDAFLDTAPQQERDATRRAFAAIDGAPGKYLADLYSLARLRLARAGVVHVSGGDICTVTERSRFYSYRRDRVTGRMAAAIWLAD